jgi:hypothetical protein
VRSALTCLGLAAALVPLARAAESLPALKRTDDGASIEDALPPASQRTLAFGFTALLSDWYWLQAIQYYGTPANRAEHFRGLAELLDLTTNLDPDFDYAYQFGGVSLPYHDETDKLWYNTAAAIRLLQKASSTHVSRWQVPWELGYNLYTFRGDYTEAGKAIAIAAKRANAPPYLESLALRLLAQGGELATALELTRAALSQAKEDREKTELQQRILALLLQQDLTKLNAAVDTLRARGRKPDSIQELFGVDGLTSIPDDPFGGQFEIDQQTGEVRSQHADKLLRLHVHPGEPAVERVAD